MRSPSRPLAATAAAIALTLSLTAWVPLIAQPAAIDSARALRELVAVAAARNRVPPALLGYEADVETEISLIIRRSDGTEIVGAVEQIASRLSWDRTGRYDQRIRGHRMQQLGAGVSVLSGFRTGWINPTLYGNRLRARPRDGAAVGTNARDSAPRDTLPVVHPLADDRERWYTYRGGDTIVTLRDGDRRVPVVRVLVSPRDDVTSSASLFRGELHLDASRGALVRLRGGFEDVLVGPAPAQRGNVLTRLIARSVQGVALADYENAERERAYWLPVTQRIELQVAAPMVSDGRAVVRIVSRLMSMSVREDAALRLAVADSAASGAAQTTPADVGRPDTLRTRRRLSFAPADTLRAFTNWQYPLGALSEGLHADDFEDIGPDRWRAVGLPRFDWGVPNGADLLRINRVEGVFTGFGARLALRDLSPGTVLRATAGYAWSEGTMRGRVEVQRDRGPWRGLLRVGRGLDITNDFRNPLDSGSALAALTGLDEYDYVDRRFATAVVQRTIGARQWVWRAETGVARDDDTPARLTASPIGNTAFRANRHVDAGTYWRNAFTLLWRPDGSAEFLKPGWSARLFAEQGIGELDFVRLEARVTARRQVGPFTAIARADAGTLLGDTPPTQQLFELGRSQGLPGFEYKAFAGTQSGAVRGLLLYTAPVWREPIRFGRSLILPAFAPGFSVGVQSGITRAPGTAALDAVRRLGLVADSTGTLVPVSRVSDGWRSSVNAGFRFFSGSMFLGAARPLERGEKWRWLLTFGQQL
ncbi:MAG: hypothetical protein MUD17_07640 [Gemmatimonadaceae bacterium]|nr:hypothetical protein [Gemmatimonadaceae bacterium]